LKVRVYYVVVNKVTLLTQERWSKDHGTVHVIYSGRSGRANERIPGGASLTVANGCAVQRRKLAKADYSPAWHPFFQAQVAIHRHIWSGHVKSASR